MRRLRIASLQAFAGVILSLFVTSTVLAWCGGWFPPGRAVMPADNTKVMVVFEDGKQSLIVQPEFVGFAEDFGLILPAPALPSVSDADPNLFDKLEDFTNPIPDFDDDWGCGGDFCEGIAFADSGSSERAVQVIERRDVGQYTATVLSATDADEFNEWLEQNGYESDLVRDDMIDYYVETNGYFVALKVNLSKLSSNTRSPSLDPIQITYEADAPFLPTKILSANPGVLEYTVYVLAPEPYVVPGGDVQFSTQLGMGDVLFGHGQVLLDYNAYGQWLTRNNFSIDPDRIESDMPLLRIADTGSSVVEIDRSRFNVNADEFVPGSGVVRDSWECNDYVSPLDEFLESGAEGDLSIDEYQEEFDRLQQQSSQYADPDECEGNWHSFDQAIGEPKTKGGFPLKVTMQLLGVLLLLAFVCWRVRIVKRTGSWRRLFPNPFTIAHNGIRWINHKTGHKLFPSSKQREMSAQSIGMSSSLIGAGTIWAWLLTAIIEVKFLGLDQDRFGNSHWVVMWTAIVFLGVFLGWAAYAIFILPTILGVKRGGQAVWAYLGALLISAVVVGLATYGLIEVIDSSGWLDS